jgi:hypothetical protein
MAMDAVGELAEEWDDAIVVDLAEVAGHSGAMVDEPPNITDRRRPWPSPLIELIALLRHRILRKAGAWGVLTTRFLSVNPLSLKGLSRTVTSTMMASSDSRPAYDGRSEVVAAGLPDQACPPALPRR